MKKIGDKIYLTEEEASPGFLCPERARVTAIPLCSVCKNWDGYGKCKKLGKSPDSYREAVRQDCSNALLDTDDCSFGLFSELYPEATKKLLERQEQK